MRTFRWVVILVCGALAAGISCSPPGEQPGPDAGPVGSEACDEAGLVDWDGDTIADEMEGEADPDGDGQPARLDLDSDGDGRSDEEESGRRRCEEPVDSDGDGTPDFLDLDSDDNGIRDEYDDDADTDHDTVPNWRDPDDDGDAIDDATELGLDPLDFPDSDMDGIPDYHDPDSDDDGIPDSVEGAGDPDADGLGNWRDLDSDGDGLPDETEGTGDCDGDGLGNWIDIDSDGDGVPDWDPEGAIPDGACPRCSPDCESSGPIEPSPDDAGTEGLVPNPDGEGVIIGSTSVDAGFAWIANSEDPWTVGSGWGTVTKLDLDTGEEVGRFLVGLAGQGNSPSRTAVDGNADAYIACRAFGQQGTVVKIAAREEDCIDRNRNGRIDTSRDSTPLPLGEDECVLWSVEVGAMNGTPRALVIDFGGPDAAAGFPWVGLHEEHRMVQLDPDTGAELASVPTTVYPYGAALDPSGNIWISGFMDGAIQRLDPLAGTTDPQVSLMSGGCEGPYGIATDSWGRVWVGAYAPSACRYDPSDGSFFRVAMPDSSHTTRGVAVDAFDRVWVAAHSWGMDGYLYGFDADDGLDLRGYPTGGGTPVGVAVDSLGYIWAVNQDTNNATRLDPVSETTELFPVGNLPYTYSDFTGFQRSRVWSSGSWRHVFERCPDVVDPITSEWGNMVFSVHTPSSTSVEIEGRTADDLGRLESADLVTMAELPGTSSPVEIEAIFAGAGIATGRYLEVVVTLRSAGGSSSPVFESLEVGWTCDDGPVE